MVFQNVRMSCYASSDISITILMMIRMNCVKKVFCSKCKSAKIALSAPINSRLKVVVRSPTPFEVEMAVGLPEVPSYPKHFPQTNHFLPCCPLNDRRRAARSFSGIDRPFSLFSCLFLTRLLILLLLLMSGKVHPFPVQCALETRPGRIGWCNAAPAPNESI